jgi:hypothetical protein
MQRLAICMPLSEKNEGGNPVGIPLRAGNEVSKQGEIRI